MNVFRITSQEDSIYVKFSFDNCHHKVSHVTTKKYIKDTKGRKKKTLTRGEEGKDEVILTAERQSKLFLRAGLPST